MLAVLGQGGGVLLPPSWGVGEDAENMPVCWRGAVPYRIGNRDMEPEDVEEMSVGWRGTVPYRMGNREMKLENHEKMPVCRLCTVPDIICNREMVLENVEKMLVCWFARFPTAVVTERWSLRMSRTGEHSWSEEYVPELRGAGEGAHCLNLLLCVPLPHGQPRDGARG